MAFADLSGKTNHLSKINVGPIGTVQWYLQIEGQNTWEKLEQKLLKMHFADKR